MKLQLRNLLWFTGHVAVHSEAAGGTDASVRAPLSARPAGVVRGGISGACASSGALSAKRGFSSHPHLPADADTALIDRPAVIVIVIVPSRRTYGTWRV